MPCFPHTFLNFIHKSHEIKKLNYLYSIGNLHSGNVFIGPNGSPYLSEFEGYLLGASSILRPFFTQLKGPSSSAEAVDVYCFGHLLYEMAVGTPLQNPTCDNALPNHLPEQLSKFKSFHMNKTIFDATDSTKINRPGYNVGSMY